MPIYEYQCDGCQEVFEVRQRMTDPAPAAHACGSTSLHRVLSATSFVLKGTGWYATDYGNRSQPPPERGEGDGGSGDKTSKNNSNSDSKANPSGKDAGAAAKDGPKASGQSTGGQGQNAAGRSSGNGGSGQAPTANKPGPKGGGSPAAA